MEINETKLRELIKNIILDEARSNAKDPGKFWTLKHTTPKPKKNAVKINDEDMKRYQKEYAKIKLKAKGAKIMSFNKYVDTQVHGK